MTRHPTTHQETYSKVNLGFWLYLMTDCVLFASLFATYAVLSGNTHGGPGAAELFSLPFVLIETLLLLTSSFTMGLTMLAAQRYDKVKVLWGLAITFGLGLAFLSMELYEFTMLVQEGQSWQRSGFLSAFFTLVGTHGLHITAGLIWLAVLIQQIARRSFTTGLMRKLTLVSLFWHFLDIIWIFIFTMVYLIGAA